MMTLASGRSIEVSPTLEMSTVLKPAPPLKSPRIHMRCVWLTEPSMAGRFSRVAYSLRAKTLSEKMITLSPRASW